MAWRGEVRSKRDRLHQSLQKNLFSRSLEHFWVAALHCRHCSRCLTNLRAGFANQELYRYASTGLRCRTHFGLAPTDAFMSGFQHDWTVYSSAWVCHLRHFTVRHLVFRILHSLHGRLLDYIRGRPLRVGELGGGEHRDKAQLESFPRSNFFHVGNVADGGVQLWDVDGYRSQHGAVVLWYLLRPRGRGVHEPLHRPALRHFCSCVHGRTSNCWHAASQNDCCPAGTSVRRSALEVGTTYAGQLLPWNGKVFRQMSMRPGLLEKGNFIQLIRANALAIHW